jgi:hypothetical protein
MRKMTTSPDDIRLAILKGDVKYMTPEEIVEHEKKETIEAVQQLGGCYDDILNYMGQWVDIPEHYKKLIAIWIIGTYYHKQFDTFPYLFLNAMRGSGKTRLLKIISWLQYNGKGEVLTNPSDAVIFRTAQETGLIFDEFESEKSKDKQTMREYLNACYKKGGVVYRMEKQKDASGKEKQIAMPHPLYTPVAMANINGIEDVLQDRSLTLILEKSMNPALVKKIENFTKDLKLKEIKANLSKLQCRVCSVELLKKGTDEWNSFVDSKYSTQLHTIHTLHNPQTLQGLNSLEFFNKIDESNIFGRNLELLFPLILVSKLLGESIFEEFLGIAKTFNTAKKEDEFAESKDVVLIEFISKAERHRFEYVFVHDLFAEFKAFMGNLYDSEDKEKWVTMTWFGLALKRLKLIGTKKRVAKGAMLLLDVDKAKERLKIFKTEEKKDEPTTP